MLLLLLSCAGDADLPPETEGNPQWAGSWEAPAGELVQDGATLSLDGHVIATDVLGTPAIVGDRVALVRRPETSVSVSVLQVLTLGGEPVTLVDEGSPDRVALSPDAQWVAFCWGKTGISSVWAVPFSGGEPVQLTNVDLVRGVDGEPVGFVPPPHTGPLRFEGDTIVWDSPDGTHRVELP